MRVTVAIPTLSADEGLARCVAALTQQTLDGFEVVVVDNSGDGLARKRLASGNRVRILENACNTGFGAAVNRAWREGTGEFVATLNDDTVPCARWLEHLVKAMDSDSRIGMCASQVRLAATGEVDSAGMRICRDGSSKQRGHREKPEAYDRAMDVLCPSGSAALYRRRMIEDTGGFDEDFFLYCEDTDLGLRAQWAGWRCMYVPEAVVAHEYSQTAGEASPLKAYLVERNRLHVALKNFPLRWLMALPWVAACRYFWHWRYMRSGLGKAARFTRGGGSVWRLGWIIVKAHVAVAWSLPTLLRKRRSRVQHTSRVEFTALLERHEISPREVAAL